MAVGAAVAVAVAAEVMGVVTVAAEVLPHMAGVAIPGL